MSGAQSISTRRAYGVQRVCRVWHCARSSVYVSLIRFGGHLPKGEYDVDHDGDAGQADAAELHG